MKQMKMNRETLVTQKNIYKKCWHRYLERLIWISSSERT